MTRAEAAQMFYNLLLDQDVSSTVRFTDVPADAGTPARWRPASLGMVEGVGGGKFAPERTITRAEFTVMAMHFARLPEGGENPFSDVTSSDWFYDQVVGAVQYGWITATPTAPSGRRHHHPGGGDGHHQPLLDWAADEDYVDDHAGELRQFPDVSASYWAYHDIVEAPTPTATVSMTARSTGCKYLLIFLFHTKASPGTDWFRGTSFIPACPGETGFSETAFRPGRRGSDQSCAPNRPAR